MDKQCPYCAETIKAAAIRCRYCHADLTSTMPAAAALAFDIPAPVSATVATPAIATPAPVKGTVVPQTKSTAVGYLWFFLLGTFGAHRFYFRREGSAMGQGGLMVLALIVVALVGADERGSGLFVFGLFLYALVLLWLVIDLFLIPGWAREFNAAEVLETSGQSSTLSPAVLHK